LAHGYCTLKLLCSRAIAIRNCLSRQKKKDRREELTNAMCATKAKLTIIINIIQTKWNPKHKKFIIVYGLLQCINKPEKSQDT